MRNLLTALATLTLFATSAFAAPASEHRPPPEMKQTTPVKKARAAAFIHRISSATKKGVVTAADKSEKGLVKAADKTEKGVGKAADKTEKGVSKAADKTKQTAKKTAAKAQ